MGKHKDPEVAGQTGKADQTDKADQTNQDQDGPGDAAGQPAEGGGGREGTGSGRKAAKDTQARKDESAGAPDSPGKSNEKAPEETSETAEGRSAETAGERAGRAEEREHPEHPDPEHPDPEYRERHEDQAYHDEAMSSLADQVVEERGHRTLYATLFYVLLGIIVVIGLTLWAAPKVAPHVPGFIAQYLVPGQVGTAEQVAALEQRLAERASRTDAELAALRDRLESLSAEAGAAAPSEETEAAIGAAREAADAAAEEVGALAERIDNLEGRLTGMREEVNAISETLTGAGEGAAPAELAAAINSLQRRVDQLAGAVEGGPPTAELAQRLEALTARLEEMQGNLAEAQEAGTEVSSAIREARLQSAFDTLAARLAAGQAYAAPLSEIATLSETEAPEALAAGAETGVPSATELEATFGRHAQAAISANIRAASSDNTVGEAVGWLRAQVAGRPVSEQEGDTVPAITSRIAARLEEGRLEAALREAESLPEPAREALGGWLERLRARVTADKALAAWRDQVTAKG